MHSGMACKAIGHVIGMCLCAVLYLVEPQHAPNKSIGLPVCNLLIV